MHPKSFVLVTIQFVTLGYLALTGHLFVAPQWIGLELLGLAVGAWAVLTVGPKRVTPLPDLPRNARLVTRGPYRWVRHPMYLAVLLIASAWLLDTLTPVRLLVGAILLANMLTKAAHEESLLRTRFPEYAAYQRRTKKLIPFVY